eukprot:CAMPEP_0185193936 /NCGR_PEP_ID=MMETSP1140-20130426/28427_1 /TAXON_ID=298111 /ORGANISM="Pavlova sp., Strain CCMP459" /LENGTH=33 /DNA_ID= /DNA_START= /DNA_END= /DNA_ORIENTATION=
MMQERPVRSANFMATDAVHMVDRSATRLACLRR